MAVESSNTTTTISSPPSSSSSFSSTAEQEEEQRLHIPPNPHPTRLHGRAFYHSLGSPKYILAPMVEHSHLAWRLLVSRYLPKPTTSPTEDPIDPTASPTSPPILTYTPMLHSRLYHTTPSYPHQNFPAAHNTLDGHPSHDRPLLAQFCANDPSAFLASAELIAPYVDGVDLNLGCPQGIARKGRYGSFLQDEWSLINSLIGTLHGSPSLPVPVTAKIRIFPDKKKTLEYARMVLSSGASILAVHGRTREQKGHNTGLADWATIRYLREHLPRDTVIFANGNLLYPGDAQRCLTSTGADGVLSAEGCLHNPTGIFLDPTLHPPEHLFPRVDTIARQYLSILRTKILPYMTHPSRATDPIVEPNLTNVKSHFFKLFHALLPRFPDIRASLATSRPRNIPADPLADFEAVVSAVETVIHDELARNPEPRAPHHTSVGLVKIGDWYCMSAGWTGPQRRSASVDVTPNPQEVEVEVACNHWDIPFYRCQPYLRPLPHEAVSRGAMSAAALTTHPRSVE